MTYFCERFEPREWSIFLKTSSQLACLLSWLEKSRVWIPYKPEFFSVLSFRNCISNYNNLITKSKGGFPLSRNFEMLVYERKFHTHNKIMTIKVWSVALKREVGRGSTFTFTCDRSNIASLLTANVNFSAPTHVKITRQWKSTYPASRVSFDLPR